MKAISLVALSPGAGRNSLAGPFLRLVLASAISMGLLISPNANAQLAGAIERAIAKRAAVKSANRVIPRSIAKNGSATVAIRTAKGNYLVKRWNNNLVKEWDVSWATRWDKNLCNSKSSCPLPNELGKTFKGGTYDEVILSPKIPPCTALTMGCPPRLEESTSSEVMAFPGGSWNRPKEWPL